MGPMNAPIIPMAYRRRHPEPQKDVTHGITLYPNDPKKAITFWAYSYAEAMLKAKEGGYNV